MNNNLVFFHSGDFIPKSTFTAFPCHREAVYVSGLEVNNVFLEDTRGLRLYRDEEVFLCTDNTTFNVYTKEDTIYIGTIKINWNTNCSLYTEPYLEDSIYPDITSTTKTIQNHTTSTSNTSSNTSILETTNSSIFVSNTKIYNEEIAHEPLGIRKEKINKSNTFYITSIILLTILLCIIFIKMILKGEDKK